MSIPEYVCTCGCKWGNDAPMSYEDLFLKKKVAILGAENAGVDAFKEISPDYLVAIKNGHQLSYVGKATENPQEKTWEDIVSQEEADKYGFDLGSKILVVNIEQWLPLKDVTYQTQAACNWIDQKHPASKECIEQYKNYM